MTRPALILLACLALTGGRHATALASGPGSAGPPSCPPEVYAYDWPADEACTVSFCESSWQADAYNAGNYGLFQLWSGWAGAFGLPVAALYDRAINVFVAYRVWQSQGWAPWSCSPYGVMPS